VTGLHIRIVDTNAIRLCGGGRWGADGAPRPWAQSKLDTPAPTAKSGLRPLRWWPSEARLFRPIRWLPLL